MRLSEAMRLGAMLKPQDLVYFREAGKSCALGAAADALGVPMRDGDDFAFGVHALNREFPQLLKAARCPACSLLRGTWRRWRDDEYDLGDVVIHLNDDHRWTRERIADWVEGIENAQATSATSREEAGTQEHAASTAASAAKNS